MPEYDKMISDFMKQFEDETVEEETVSYPASEEIKEPVQAPDTIPERTNLQQNQGMQSSTVQSNYPPNYPQFNEAEFILNVYGDKSKCIGKAIIIPNPPNPPIRAYINHDVNYAPYLCIPNQYTPIGKIEYDGCEYAVYQGHQKVGTLSYNSLNDTVWQFVPLGSVMHQQTQSNRYLTPNTQQSKYIFNNVPPEQADSIIRSIMEIQPQTPVEINFAPSSMKSESPLSTNE